VHNDAGLNYAKLPQAEHFNYIEILLSSNGENIRQFPGNNNRKRQKTLKPKVTCRWSTAWDRQWSPEDHLIRRQVLKFQLAVLTHVAVKRSLA
jgi:hypothetical protein